ncbi:MAG: hypothetical protein SFU83_03015 [Meiothermus sp.]|nr:hypothetical protein [Meiothermus sp.]
MTKPPDPPEYELLRRLLLQPEQERLQELGDPEVWERQVSEALPGALTQRARRDKTIQAALNPIIEESFFLLVKRNPKLLVEILFPVLLPAIRRAVTVLLAQLTQSLNATLDQTFTPQGIRWRLEAITTGKSFAEVVLSNTLLYRVEQVLLIHRDSGLLILHEVAEGVKVQDGAMVSGMLTAIGDFVRDSFDPGAGLNTVDFGERTLMVQQSPRAVLGLVVRGTAQPELQGRMEEALVEVHTQFGRELAHFNGDSSPLAAAAPVLEGLLETAYKPKASRRPYMLIAVGVALLALLGGWGWTNYQADRAWSTYLQRLESAPGIVVTSAPRRYRLEGLRDPLASDPITYLEGLPIRPERLQARWLPFQSLEPELLLRRLRLLLNTPETVQLNWQDGVLVATGTAAPEWRRRLVDLAATFGVERLQNRVVSP